MKLWVDGAEGSPGTAVRAAVKRQVEFINRKAVSRGTRAVQAIRKAELQVLKGERSGRVYKKPGTYGEKFSRSTKKLMKDYGHKLRGGQLYRASAPGEPPAVRTGNLRMHWNGHVIPVFKPNGVEIIAQLECQEKYAEALEKGKGMARRPFRTRIMEKADPEIRKIYNEPYT